MVLVMANTNAVAPYKAGDVGVMAVDDPLVVNEWFTPVDESTHTRVELDELAHALGLNPADYDTKADVLGAITDAATPAEVDATSGQATPGTLAPDGLPSTG